MRTLLTESKSTVVGDVYGKDVEVLEIEDAGYKVKFDGKTISVKTSDFLSAAQQKKPMPNALAFISTEVKDALVKHFSKSLKESSGEITNKEQLMKSDAGKEALASNGEIDWMIKNGEKKWLVANGFIDDSGKHLKKGNHTLKESKESKVSKVSKTSKEGVLIGTTKGGQAVKVHKLSRDQNGNTGFTVDFGGTRKRFIQHSPKLMPPSDIKKISAAAKKYIVNYVSEYVLKEK
jgi:hypothetical protein